MVDQYEIQLPGFERGFHLITSHVIGVVKGLPEKGLINVFIKHTSAGLTINENADPTVRVDFESSFNKLVAEMNLFTNTHLKAAMTCPLT